MPGPLPDPDSIRRNAPTVPTMTLPLSGRKGDPPDVPAWVTLSTMGRAWWAWAWTTPQAVAWGTSVGMESTVARRASLEDDLAAIESGEGLDWSEAMATSNTKDLRDVVARVAALVSNRLQILKQMDTLDDRLGLSPKAMAFLRWKIVDDTPAEQQPAPTEPGVTNIDSRRARLTDAS